MSNFLYITKYSLAKPGALRDFKQALNNQFLPTEDLNSLNWKKTRRLLDYVYEHVPYYRQSFDSIGLHPSDISRPEHFEQVPVLRREEIINNYDLFFSDEINPKKMKLSTTGGSTGVPLKIAMSPKLNREISKWRMLEWWGLGPNADMASLYRGVPVSGLKKIALGFINWPQNVIRFDATNMNTANIKAFIDEMKTYKPDLIHGYVGAVDAIADYLLEHNIEIPAPKTIWLTAAPVTKIQEEKITQAFKAPVCDQYGCSELYFISAECPKKEGLHVFEDSIKLEFLDNQDRSVKKGVYGNIVLTNLEEYGFPLIRYANGDRGRYLQHQCSCGMTLPLMDKVKGRVSDNIVLPGGEVISGEYLTTIFDDFTDDVKQFQVIQRKDDSIDINVVFSSLAKQKEIINYVLEEFSKRVNNQVPVQINVVDTIGSIKGKLQFIIRESK
jgi:phenylacetate-CoA ligase